MSALLQARTSKTKGNLVGLRLDLISTIVRLKESNCNNSTKYLFYEIQHLSSNFATINNINIVESCVMNMKDGIAEDPDGDYPDDYGSDKRKKANRAMNDLFDCVNVIGGEQEVTDAMLDAVSHQHRTLKQAMMRAVIIPFINSFARTYEENNYDLRNEASCKLCHELKKITDRHRLPFI